MYKLGCYNADGSLECLRIVKEKEDAKCAYKHLKEEYACTVWVQKIEFVDPKEEFGTPLPEQEKSAAPGTL